MKERTIRRKRVMLVSGAVILLCFCMIVGATYALFTDSISAVNHLQAGTLNITLDRIALTTRTLDDKGYLVSETNENKVSFTNSSTANLFGLTEATRIVPGSYFDATLAIGNGGNVAFTYGITIRMNGTSNALAEQLQVTVYHPDGSETVKKLSELAEGLSITAGEMSTVADVQTFRVKVEFCNLDNDGSINNAAQTLGADFDLIVTAVQATQ